MRAGVPVMSAEDAESMLLVVLVWLRLCACVCARR